jgi:hypothetical protein
MVCFMGVIQSSSDNYAYFLQKCDTQQMFGYFSMTREFQGFQIGYDQIMDFFILF